MFETNVIFYIILVDILFFYIIRYTNIYSKLEAKEIREIIKKFKE